MPFFLSSSTLNSNRSMSCMGKEVLASNHSTQQFLLIVKLGKNSKVQPAEENLLIFTTFSNSKTSLQGVKNIYVF